MRVSTHSSRIQLPTETPPQLMPPTRLPARLSLLGLSAFLFGLFMEIGLAPPKESCRVRPLGSWPEPLIMAEVLESSTPW